MKPLFQELPFPIDSHIHLKKYLPIPQSEIDKSDGYLVQNPHF